MVLGDHNDLWRLRKYNCDHCNKCTSRDWLIRHLEFRKNHRPNRGEKLFVRLEKSALPCSKQVMSPVFNLAYGIIKINNWF